MYTIDLTAKLAALGGVARTRALREAGATEHQIEKHVADGLVSRPRKGWVAAADADQSLVAAARAGVVLTCVSQAARLGLWVHAERDHLTHVSPSTHRPSYDPSKVVAHWAKPVVPRHPNVLVDPIENVLAHVAECQPFERALAVWDSALNKQLVSLPVLQRYKWRPAARHVLESATPFADSGLETYLRARLKWLGLPLRLQAWIAGHPTDALIGERLILQADGATHTGAQRDEDIRHDAELRLMGYHVIRVSYHQIMNSWPAVQEMLMRAIAQGLHLADPWHPTAC